MVVNVVGFILADITTLAFSGMTTEGQWRLPLGLQLIFVVIILSMVPILPEAPKWLLSRGRDAEAKSVLASLEKQDSDVEYLTIRQSVRIEKAAEASWSQLFQGGQTTRRVLLGMLLQVWLVQTFHSCSSEFDSSDPYHESPKYCSAAIHRLRQQ